MNRLDSYIFRTVVRFAFWLIQVFAIYLLLRGHNLPGGGFIGGLAAAIALVLLSLALGVPEVRKVVRIDPVRIAAAGLGLAILTSAAPMCFGRPFLEHFMAYVWLPLLGKTHVGTPLVFDIGVYLVVIGITCKTIFVLATSTQGMRALMREEERRYSSILEQPIEESRPEEPPARGQPGGNDAD